MDWFLYDGDLRHEKVNELVSMIRTSIMKKLTFIKICH